MRALGDKARAKALAMTTGVPLLAGYHGDMATDEDLMRAADEVGFPLLVKASAGGGGRGMRLVRTAEDLPEALAAARREAAAAFGDDRLLLERFVERPRHVEIQLLADTRRQHRAISASASAPSSVVTRSSSRSRHLPL